MRVVMFIAVSVFVLAGPAESASKPAVPLRVQHVLQQRAPRAGTSRPSCRPATATWSTRT